jgi:hypothetical protein
MGYASGDSVVNTGNLVDDAVTLAKMAPGTDGNLITYDASGNPAAVATGTSGQVLTSGGAGVAPTMQTPSSFDTASPGAIGGTTPGSGAFTTVSATGITTLSDGSAAAPSLNFSGDTDAGLFLASANVMGIAVAGAEKARFESSGGIMFNDVGNAVSTIGLTISQGANDDEIMAFKSSDVAHGMTASTETDTYLKIEKYQTAQGGPAIRGYSETYYGLHLEGNVTNTSTTHSTSGTAMVNVAGRVKSGSGPTVNVGSNVNVLGVFGEAWDFCWTVDSSGNTYYDGTSNASAWDDHDDKALLDAFRHVTMTDKTMANRVFGNFISEHAQVLHDTGVIEMNDNGRHFVSTKGLNALIIDSIRQTNDKMSTVVKVAEDMLPGFGKKLAAALATNKLPALG